MRRSWWGRICARRVILLRRRGVVSTRRRIHRTGLHREILLLSRRMTRSCTEIVILSLQMRSSKFSRMILSRRRMEGLLIGELTCNMRGSRVVQPNPGLVDLKQVLDQRDEIDSLWGNEIDI